MTAYTPQKRVYKLIIPVVTLTAVIVLATIVTFFNLAPGDSSAQIVTSALETLANKGTAYQVDNRLRITNRNQWVTLGGKSGDLTGMVFNGDLIWPENATLIKAELVLVSRYDHPQSLDNLNIDIYAERNLAPQPFSTEYPISTRQLTTSFVNYETEAIWSSNETINIEITEPIQELSTSELLTNNIGIVLKSNGAASTYIRLLYNHQHPELMPQLHLTFNDGIEVTMTPTATPIVLPSVTPTPASSPVPTTPPVIGSCTHTLAGTSLVIDGREAPYEDIGPGSVVCLQSGNRGKVTIQNLRGTPAQPIIFTNVGGQVNLTSLSMNNTQYFRLTGVKGSVVPSNPYGIKIDANGSVAAKLLYKTDNYEVDHIEITDASIGFNSKTKATCLDGSGNEWDFDDDGEIVSDMDDMVDQSNYAQSNMSIHHVYIHDVDNEGMYLGSNDTAQSPRDLDDENPQCLAARNPLMANLEVYSNTINDFGLDGINVKGGRVGCNIHHNQLLRGSNEENSGQTGSIKPNSDSSCMITHNYIIDGFGPGIHDNGLGQNLIANNVIVRAGRAFPNADKGSAILIDGSNASATTLVLNNTIIMPARYGIKTARNTLVQNNVIVVASDTTLGIQVSGSSTSTDNVVKQFSDIEELGFINIAPDPENPLEYTENYRFYSTSILKDSGINVGPYGVVNDIDGITRPRGDDYDVGAYEFAL